MTLIARYKLDGNARDSEGSAHGTAIDVTWAPSQLVDGGGEARLNGTTSRIETAIQFTTETTPSLPVWFRPRQGAGHLVGQHDGTNGLAVEQTETGKIRLVVNGTASAEVTVYPGEYHHVVPVYDNGEATLYLDNEAVATVTATVTWPAVPVTLGARADGSAPLACDVVDVRGYDQALEALEVEQLASDIDLLAIDPDYITIPNDGLVSHYTMDSISGTELIDEVGNVNGVISDAWSAPGKLDNALAFDGSNDYVSLGDSFGFTSSFSLSFWCLSDVQDPGASGHGVIARDSSGGDRGWSAQLHTAAKSIRFGVSPNGSTYTNRDCSEPITAGVWHHFVCVYDAANLLLDVYKDGQLRNGSLNNGPIPSSLYVSTASASIGSILGTYTDSSSVMWNGLIDQCRIFDRALSAAEAEALYNDSGAGAIAEFPFATRRSVALSGSDSAGYNPHPTAVPNPSAIPRSGRSIVQGVTALLAPPAWFDQRDGSGGSHLSPEGVVSRPDRQGRLSGNTTDQNGQPVSRRVRCFERRTGRIVRETWSNAAGYYQFDDLDPGKRFTVVAHDYSGTYNAVIADNAQPEVPA